MNYKVAVCITTFMRDDLLQDTLKSVIANLPDNTAVLVGDQNMNSAQKCNQYQSLEKGIFYYSLPYDSGLSFGRNYLVQQASNMDIPYVIISADSIQFTKKYDLSPLIAFLEESPERGIIGLDLADRIPWEWNIEIKDGYILLTKTNPANKIIKEDITYQECQICRNFFIAKTQALKVCPWDNELMLAEHEDFFLRFKETGLKVYWTNTIQGKYVCFKPQEYLVFRQRMYNIFRQKLLTKYHLKGWVKYGK